jgi:hypothetical protein
LRTWAVRDQLLRKNSDGGDRMVKPVPGIRENGIVERELWMLPPEILMATH